jgi:acyl carrier protein
VKTEKQLRRLIEDEFLEGAPLDEAILVEHLDSLAVEQLVGFIEDEFDVEFDDEDIVLENFKSLGSLAALVDRKRAGVPS